MNNEDLYSDLGQVWRSDAPGLAISRRDVKRAQWRIKLEKGVQAVTVALCWAFAAFFWLRGDPLINRLAAVVMLATGFVILASLALQNRGLLRWEDYSPQGLVLFRLRTTRTRIRDLRYGIGSCLFLLAFTAVIWLMRIFLPGSVPEALVFFYSLLALPLILLILLLRRVIAGKREESRELERLYEEFRDE